MQRALVTGGAGFVGSHVSADGTEFPRGSVTSDGDPRAAHDSVDAANSVGSGLATSVAEVARQRSAAFSASPRLVVTGQYRFGDIGVGRVS